MFKIQVRIDVIYLKYIFLYIILYFLKITQCLYFLRLLSPHYVKIIQNLQCEITKIKRYTNYLF